MDVSAITSALASDARTSRHTPREVALQFEALLTSQMFNAMQQTVEKSGLLDGGSAEETYRELLNQALGDALARRGGLGLAEQIARRIEQYKANAAHSYRETLAEAQVPGVGPSPSDE